MPGILFADALFPMHNPSSPTLLIMFISIFTILCVVKLLVSRALLTASPMTWVTAGLWSVLLFFGDLLLLPFFLRLAFELPRWMGFPLGFFLWIYVITQFEIKLINRIGRRRESVTVAPTRRNQIYVAIGSFISFAWIVGVFVIAGYLEGAGSAPRQLTPGVNGDSKVQQRSASSL